MNDERKQCNEDQERQKRTNTSHNPDVLGIAIAKVWPDFGIDKNTNPSGQYSRN